MMKTRQDIDVTDHKDVVYAKNEIELSWSIKQGAICDENRTGQWHDWLYSCNLSWKQNWVVMTYWTGCGLW